MSDGMSSFLARPADRGRAEALGHTAGSRSRAVDEAVKTFSSPSMLLPAGAALVHDNVYGDYQDQPPDAELPELICTGPSVPVLVARSFSKADRLFGLRVSSD